MGYSYKAETVVSARTSGTSVATETVTTVTEIEGIPLSEFDEIHVYVKSSQNIVGTGSQLTLYLQRPVVPDYAAATDAHWADLTSSPLVSAAGTASIDAECHLPVVFDQPDTAAVAWRTRTLAAMTASDAHVGAVGPAIRIQEKRAGTITTPLIYSIHMVGVTYRRSS